MLSMGKITSWALFTRSSFPFYLKLPSSQFLQSVVLYFKFGMLITLKDLQFTRIQNLSTKLLQFLINLIKANCQELLTTFFYIKRA